MYFHHKRSSLDHKVSSQVSHCLSASFEHATEEVTDEDKTYTEPSKITQTVESKY